jgi:hypothetical protein
MKSLISYVCDELEDLERKAEKGKLTAAEVQYADTLAHLKKNLLKADEMMGYSNNDYARRRDYRGRYSGEDYSYRDVAHDLRSLMNRMPEDVRPDAQRLMQRLES